MRLCGKTHDAATLALTCKDLNRVFNDEAILVPEAAAARQSGNALSDKYGLGFNEWGAIGRTIRVGDETPHKLFKEKAHDAETVSWLGTLWWRGPDATRLAREMNEADNDFIIHAFRQGAVLATSSVYRPSFVDEGEWVFQVWPAWTTPMKSMGPFGCAPPIHLGPHTFKTKAAAKRFLKEQIARLHHDMPERDLPEAEMAWVAPFLNRNENATLRGLWRVEKRVRVGVRDGKVVIKFKAHGKPSHYRESVYDWTAAGVDRTLNNDVDTFVDAHLRLLDQAPAPRGTTRASTITNAE